MAKKSSLAREQIERRLALNRWQARLGEKVRRKARRSAANSVRVRPSSQPSRRAAIVGKQRAPWFDVVVPPVLDFDTAYEATCKFVVDIRGTLRMGKNVRLRFDDVQRIRMGALTFLVGQIHKLRLELGDHRLTGSYPLNQRIERLLSESGFYKLLNVKSRAGALPPSKTVRYISFRTDQKINGAEIARVREDLLGSDLKMPPNIARLIFRAISEAMTNVNHHGYHRKVFPSPTAALRMRGRWWMMATLNIPKNVFKLVFYDAGVGIPSTLPRKYNIELIRKALSLLPGFRPDDGQMIEAAMELGRTRTELDNRGKGLLDLAKLIDMVGLGKMRILSRHGAYLYRADGSRKRRRRGRPRGRR